MQEPKIPGVEVGDGGVVVAARSSIEITENSKAEPACRVKGYADDGETLEELGARVLAAYKQVRSQVLT